MAVGKFPIEYSHIMMFARSVGDANNIYYDQDYAASTEPGGVIAPPTFVQASAQFDPDYFLRPKIGQEWFGSAKGRQASRPSQSRMLKRAEKRRRAEVVGDCTLNSIMYTTAIQK